MFSEGLRRQAVLIVAPPSSLMQRGGGGGGGEGLMEKLMISMEAQCNNWIFLCVQRRMSLIVQEEAETQQFVWAFY